MLNCGYKLNKTKTGLSNFSIMVSIITERRKNKHINLSLTPVYLTGQRRDIQESSLRKTAQRHPWEQRPFSMTWDVLVVYRISVFVWETILTHIILFEVHVQTKMAISTLYVNVHKCKNSSSCCQPKTSLLFRDRMKNDCLFKLLRDRKKQIPKTRPNALLQ